MRAMMKRTTAKSEDAACLPPRIDIAHEHYPFCVVWTPIPLLTWLLPFVGHIGICDSQGRIYDFQGDYSIGDDRMLFGRPTRYWDVSRLFVPSFYSPPSASSDEGKDDARNEAIRREVEDYDRAIFNVIQHFRRNEHYSFCCNNCHAFVAACLNAPALSAGKSDTFTVCLRTALHGRFVSAARCVKTLLPFAILVCFVIVMVSVFS